MKRAAALTSVSFLASSVQANGLSSDWVNGFETGIFMRDDENVYYDYSCDKPAGDSALMEQAQSIIAPMKMMKMFMKDEKLASMCDTFEIFANSASELELVMMGSYDGGDFCSGLIFGKAGSKLLIDIAQRFVKIPDEHNPALKEPRLDLTPSTVVVNKNKPSMKDQYLQNDKNKK